MRVQPSPQEPAVFVGESRFVRCLALGLVGFGLLLVLWAWPDLPAPVAFFFVGSGALVARTMPWRFVVTPMGLDLWFAGGRSRFLAKRDVTVRVWPGSPVALVGPRRRFGYPLTSGFVDGRRAELRAVLEAYGFDVR